MVQLVSKQLAYLDLLVKSSDLVNFRKVIVLWKLLTPLPYIKTNALIHIKVRYHTADAICIPLTETETEAAIMMLIYAVV